MYTHSEWDLTKQKPSTQFFFGCYYDLTIFPFTSIIYFIWRVSITLTIFIIFHRTNAHEIGPSIWYNLQSVLFYCRYLFLFLFVCLFPSLFSLEFFFRFFWTLIVIHYYSSVVYHFSHAVYAYLSNWWVSIHRLLWTSICYQYFSVSRQLIQFIAVEQIRIVAVVIE